jgi:hypothetical protein
MSRIDYEMKKTLDRGDDSITDNLYMRIAHIASCQISPDILQGLPSEDESLYRDVWNDVTNEVDIIIQSYERNNRRT